MRTSASRRGRQRDLHDRVRPGEGDASTVSSSMASRSARSRGGPRLRRPRLTIAAPADRWTPAPATRSAALGTTRPVADGRKRPHQPERRPLVRLPADGVHGNREPARPPADGPSAQFRCSELREPFGTLVGANLYAASGIPVTRGPPRSAAASIRSSIRPPERRRTDMFTQRTSRSATRSASERSFVVGMDPSTCSIRRRDQQVMSQLGPPAVQFDEADSTPATSLHRGGEPCVQDPRFLSERFQSPRVMRVMARSRSNPWLRRPFAAGRAPDSAISRFDVRSAPAGPVFPGRAALPGRRGLLRTRLRAAARRTPLRRGRPGAATGTRRMASMPGWPLTRRGVPGDHGPCTRHWPNRQR